MKRKRALLVLLAAFFLGHLIYFYPLMPEKMATHFNFANEPDGWTNKHLFFVFEIGFLAYMLAFFYLLSRFLPKLPDSLINLPNKQDWLAPGRREQTFQVIQCELETFLIPLLALFLAVNHLIFRANILRENLSQAAWLVTGGFIVFVFVWSYRLYKKFRIYENRTS